MKFITISIYISLCILFVGCKKTNSSTNEMCNCSVESIEDELELLCLKSKNDSMTLSMEITSDNMVNDYNYRYLGSLQVSSRMFEVLQKTVLSGQYKDAQRALVSIRFFTNGNLFGEYTGLNNFYSVKISSNNICIYNVETRSSKKINMKDSIPQLLFFHYNDKDSSSCGDLFLLSQELVFLCSLDIICITALLFSTTLCNYLVLSFQEYGKRTNIHCKHISCCVRKPFI